MIVDEKIDITIDREAILQEVLQSMEMEEHLDRMFEAALLQACGRVNRSLDNSKAYKINVIIKFIRNKIINNYILVINKLYNIIVKVLNKENLKKLLKFVIRQIGEIGLKEIIKMMVIKLMESIMKRRELSNTPYYYAQN